ACAATRFHRTVRRNGLCGLAAHARDRNSHGARGGSQRSAMDDFAARDGARVVRYRAWVGRSICFDEIPGKLDEPVADVIWRATFRSTDLWRDRGGAVAGGAGGLLYSGAPRDKGRSADCLAR